MRVGCVRDVAAYYNANGGSHTHLVTRWVWYPNWSGGALLCVCRLQHQQPTSDEVGMVSKLVGGRSSVCVGCSISDPPLTRWVWYPNLSGARFCVGCIVSDPPLTRWVWYQQNLGSACV